MEQLLNSMAISLKRTGGGVRCYEFDLNIALASAFKITDPKIV